VDDLGIDPGHSGKHFQGVSGLFQGVKEGVPG
jgi:hypothetical protein